MSVTIRDVAKAAQTSAATVSKVMNGSGSISQATIDRVEQAMRDLGYHPNARARNFARQTNKTVLFLTTLGKDAGFTNPHMFEIMAGMEEALSKKGYLLCVKSIAAEDACPFVEHILIPGKRTAWCCMPPLFHRQWTSWFLRKRSPIL